MTDQRRIRVIFKKIIEGKFCKEEKNKRKPKRRKEVKVKETDNYLFFSNSIQITN